MALTCRTCSRVNPSDARYCYHDGVALSAANGAGGPIAVGAQLFMSPFVFPSGRQCRNFDELAVACDTDWNAARDLLKQGYLERFLGGLGRVDLAIAARQAAANTDADRGLDQFLGKLPASTRDAAKLVAGPLDVNLGRINREGERTFTLNIENQGMGLLYGTVAAADTPWLTIGDTNSPSKLFQCRHEQTLTIHVVTRLMRAGNKPLEGKLLIESNGGTQTVTVRAEVPVKPYPDGIFTGCKTPREVAVKAKAAPKDAAPVFEKGLVKKWYESNGWIYPVQGPPAHGMGAVQQFFEALGLVTPPKVEISERRVQLSGAPGASLEYELQVRTAERRPVFAHAVTNSSWLTIGRVQMSGATARIPLKVALVPSMPGERLESAVQVTSNGGQRFTVEVHLTIAGSPGSYRAPPPPVNWADALANSPPPLPGGGGPAMVVPVVEVMDGGGPPVRTSRGGVAPLPVPYSPQPYAAAAPPTFHGVAPPTMQFTAPQSPGFPFAPGEDAPRARRAAPPNPLKHVILPLLILLGLLGMLIHDFLVKPDVEAQTQAGADVDPNPVIRAGFHDGSRETTLENTPGATIMTRGIDTMRFGVTMLGEKDQAGNPKRLTYDAYGRTNNTVVRVGGQDFIFGELPGVWVEKEGKLEADKTGRVPQGARSVWLLKDQGIQVTQTVEIVPSDPGPGETKRKLKTCLVRYKIENKGNKDQTVGLRFLLDTFIGANDGVPFVIPGDAELCLTQMEFPNRQLPNVPDYIFAVEREDKNNRGTVAQVQFRLSTTLEAPGKVLLGGWPDKAFNDLYSQFNSKRGDPDLENIIRKGNLGEVWRELPLALGQYTLWDVPPVRIRALADSGLKKKGGGSFDPDSSVTMYWEPKRMAPGGSRELGFAYGLGGVSGGGDDRILMTLGGSREVGGELTLNALVSDPQAAEVLTLDAPRGLEVLGKSDQPVPPVAAGATRKQSSVTWRLRATATGTFSLKVTSSATRNSVIQPVTIRAAGGIFQ
jgi:hypothetical protein